MNTRAVQKLSGRLRIKTVFGDKDKSKSRISLSSIHKIRQKLFYKNYFGHVMTLLHVS